MLQYSENRCVFSKRLKLSLPRSGSLTLKLSGWEFQSDGPATEKVSGPSLLSRHRGTTKRRRVADRRCCLAETSDTGTQRSVRYCGDWPCKQLYIATPSLYWTLSGTSSQWSSECRSRDKPRLYLWVLDSTLAAAFITCCNLSVTTWNNICCWLDLYM